MAAARMTVYVACMAIGCTCLVATREERGQLLGSILPFAIWLATDTEESCTLIQELLEPGVLNRSQLESLVRCLLSEGGTKTLYWCRLGSRVLVSIIQNCPSPMWTIIINVLETLEGRDVAKDEFGCIVLENLIAFSSPE